MKYTLNNNNYTEIANIYKNKMSENQLFEWLVYLTSSTNKNKIPKLKINDHIIEEDNNLRVFNLPEIEFTEKSIFTNPLAKTSLPILKPIIDYLYESYQINFLNVINEMIQNKESGIFQITSLCFRYLTENPIALEQNPQLFKDMIDNILEKGLLNNVASGTNVLRVNMLSCLNKMIDNKDLFSNDWIINKFDRILSQQFQKSTAFYHQEEILSKKIHLLDFGDFIPCSNFKSLLKGNNAIIKEEPISFFWRIDLNKFSLQHKIKESHQTVKNNLNKTFDYLRNEFEKDANILFSSSNISRGIYTIAIMHFNPELSIKLNKILDFVCSESINGAEYDEKDIHKVILRANLQDNMKVGENINRMKI